MGYLTAGDKQMLPIALRENRCFHIACGWYFRGWQPLPYQYAIHQAVSPNLTEIWGVGAGKTVLETASMAIDCITTPWFRALTTSITAKQAELSYDVFMQWMQGNPHLEHLVIDMRKKPWPWVQFYNYAEWEWRTSGFGEQGAKLIRGDEFDRILRDEAGFDPVDDCIKVLRTRLRGKRPDGTPRMGRLDVVSTPTDVLWLRQRFERGIPGHHTFVLSENKIPMYLSSQVTTYQNTHLSKQDIEAMEAELSDEEIEVEMLGNWPTYGLARFPATHVRACIDYNLLNTAYEKIRPESGNPAAGWDIQEHARHGVIKWEMPYTPDGIYIMAGDPGSGNFPERGSAPIGVLDISHNPWTLVYFEWVSGTGSITPFLERYDYARRKYRPMHKVLDTTGDQKWMQEIAFYRQSIETDGINFGADKKAMINVLQDTITSHDFRMPYIRGIERQLTSYDPDLDTKKNKIPQDIVMMMAMLMFVAQSATANQMTKETHDQYNYNRHNRASYSRRRRR
jgi:hypothetical protein